jgi:beta-galactosidase
MPAGNGVPGNLPQSITDIPVNARADALFFLHTARIDRRMDERERHERKKFELCRYVVHYADGQTVDIPIYSEIDIESFQQKAPKAIAGAQMAWSARFEDGEEQAVVYSKQWNNPRPGIQIRSVDLLPGADKDRGVPALLAITAASVSE